MGQYFELHPRNPHSRFIRSSVDVLLGDGLIVYPTDSGYAFGCRMDSKSALDRIRVIRQLDEDHHFTLVCKDVSQVSNFAKINNEAFRLIKSLTPGPFTFILKATRETPRRLQHPKRKTIGIRLPDNAISTALLTALDEPLFSSTLLLPGEEIPMSDPEDIRDRLERHVDAILGGGTVPYSPTTILGLTEDFPEIIRQGSGVVPSLR